LDLCRIYLNIALGELFNDVCNKTNNGHSEAIQPTIIHNNVKEQKITKITYKYYHNTIVGAIDGMKKQLSKSRLSQ